MKKLRNLRKPQNKHLLLVVANALIWTVNGLIQTKKIVLPARGGVPAVVNASPTRVQVRVDGNATQDGAFLQTPTQIRIAPGQHKITISRPGYITQTFSVVVNMGDSPRFDATLEQSSDVHHTFEVTSDDDGLEGQIQAAVDGGLAAGPLPLSLDDIVNGKHTLEIRSDSPEILKHPFTCSFELNSPVPVGAQVIVGRLGKKLKISGCKKMAH